jgi:3-oxoacyl-[acyl-carrier protein] reductase
MDLKRQAAVITGGSRGIGRGISLALAEAGADIVLNYRKDEKAAEEVVTRVKELGRKALSFRGDVSNFDTAKELMKHTYQAFGRIDILVNSAGIASRGNFVEKTEIEEWSRVLSTNLNGVFYCSKAVLEYMHPRKKGNIINISSIAASLLQAGHSPYAVSKAGVEALTKVLAKEEGPNGVRVNAIAPGIVKTDMGDRLMRAMGEEKVKARLETTPLGRIAYPEDIGNLVVFLVSDKAAYITGKIVHMDGGIL